MKFLHVSDLHLGKRLGERSLVEDQEHMIDEIVRIAVERKVDGVIIAGDILDDGNSATQETVRLLDKLFTDLANNHLETYAIAGNHDSDVRLEFAKQFFSTAGIHIEGIFSGEAVRYTRQDGDVPVDIYLLPFIKPIHARRVFEDDSIDDYEKAVRAALAHSEFVEGHKRILVTHQFVTGNGGGPATRESEKLYVGSIENVSYTAFDGFDYVALGHIHTCQHMGRETVMYSGTPLKYSSSEFKDEKCAVLVTIDAKGVSVEKIPMVPLRDVRVLTGDLSALLEANRNEEGRDDYIYINMTNDELDAMAKARQVFPNIISIRHVGSGSGAAPLSEEDVEGLGTAIEAFENFYKRNTGKDLTENQRKTAERIIEEKGVVL
jgi:exonuclease SbcD